MNNEGGVYKKTELNKPTTNEGLQACKSSQIIGRKINNEFLVAKNSKNRKTNANALVFSKKKKGELNRRLVGLKGSERSLSLNRNLSEKEKNNLPSFITPPRDTKKGLLTERSSQLLEDNYKVSETLCPNTPKLLRKKKIKNNKSSQILEDLSKFEKTSPYGNSNVLKRNSVKKKQEKFSDQAKDEEKAKITAKKNVKKNPPDRKKKKALLRKIVFPKASNAKLRENKNLGHEVKIKTEREVRKKKRKLADFFSGKYRGNKLNKSTENFKDKRSPETPCNGYKSTKGLKKILDSFKEEAKEKSPINFQLERSHVKRLKNKSKKKAKSMWIEDEKPFQTNRSKNNGQALEDKGVVCIDNKETINEKLRKLKQRVRKTKKDLLLKEFDSFESTARVIRIQRWFRKILAKTRLFKDLDSRKTFSQLTPQPVRSNSYLVISFENNIFASAESEGKQIRTKTSANSLHENSEIDIIINEKVPKKINKVPPLCLAAILENKSLDFQNASPENILQDSLGSDYEKEGRITSSISSADKVKQISSLDIERQSMSDFSGGSRSKTEDLEESAERIRSELNGLNEYQKDPQKWKENNEELEDNPIKKNYTKSEASYSDKKLTETLEKKLEEKQRENNTIKKPVILSRPHQDPLEKTKEITEKNEDGNLNTYQFISQKLLSDTHKEEQSLEDSCLSELSHLTDPEVQIKNILQSKHKITDDILERPEHKMICDSDSDSGNEERYPASPLQLHTDTNIAEQEINFLITKPSASEQDSTMQSQTKEPSPSEPAIIINFYNPAQSEFYLGIGFIEDYIKRLESKLKKNEDDLLELINTPSYQDPLAKLEELQRANKGELQRFCKLELILPQEVSSELKTEYDHLKMPGKMCYLQMIFDCVNEALNYIRPFGLNGLPDPWLPVSSTLFGEGQLQIVINKVMKLVRKWETTKNGILAHSLESPKEEIASKKREERLNLLIAQSVSENEEKWLVYEDEETQIKIDVSYFVFEELLEETYKLLINVYY